MKKKQEVECLLLLSEGHPASIFDIKDGSILVQSHGTHVEDYTASQPKDHNVKKLISCEDFKITACLVTKSSRSRLLRIQEAVS
jgi:hypothetical protein